MMARRPGTRDNYGLLNWFLGTTGGLKWGLTSEHTWQPATPVTGTKPSLENQPASSNRITQLPESDGFNSILVIVCLLSKMARLIPTTTDLSSLGMAKLYLEHVWRHFGFPEKHISDRGPQYASAFTRDLATLLPSF